MSARDEALRTIAELVRRHQLSDHDVLAALDRERHEPPAPRASGILASVLAYLGGIFVLAGIALFIGLQWGSFSSGARVLVTLGTGFAIYLFALATMSDQRFARVTTPMLLVAALLQPTGIVVLLNEYARGGAPEHGLLFMCAVMFAQQFLTFLARRRTALLFMSLFFGAAGFGTLCHILDLDFGITALALGIALTSTAYVVEKTPHRAISAFWYFAGSVFFLYGTFDLLRNSPVEILFFGVAAGFMYLGAVVHSRTLLLVSVLALTSFTGYFFRESLVNAFGLIFLGFLLIGLSAFAMKLSRSYVRQ